MVGAMVVLLVVVAVYVGFRAVTRENPPSPVHTVGYLPDARFAAEKAGFDLLVPPTLPDGWRATTVTFTPGRRPHWHLGLLTDRDRYVGLEQADRPVRSMLEAYVDPHPSKGAPVTVAGRPWSTWTDSGGDLALVRRGGGATTLVVGHDVPRAALVSFAASLRPPAR
jgi:hypothetical protein